MRTLTTLSLAAILLAGCPQSAQEEAMTCGGVDLGSAVGDRVATGHLGRDGGNTGDTGYWDTGYWDTGLAFADPDELPVANHNWTAPRNGRYVVDTMGSDFDTVLIARVGGCGGVIVTANDDWFDLESRIGLEMEKDQAVLLQVLGYSYWDSGTYVLNIHEQD